MSGGQAALEFLTTYGWAFLFILVMVGALSYFGVLDLDSFLPSKSEVFNVSLHNCTLTCQERVSDGFIPSGVERESFDALCGDSWETFNSSNCLYWENKSLIENLSINRPPVFVGDD